MVEPRSINVPEELNMGTSLRDAMEMAAAVASGGHWRALTVQLAAAAVVAAALLKVTAPYGRHQGGARWKGPSIDARVAWLFMESPALFYSAFIFWKGDHAREAAPLLMYTFFFAHYFHRVIIYPLRMRPSRGVPILIVALSLAFNIFNAYVQARWVSHIGSYDVRWLRSLRFLGGAAVFLCGAATNIWADSVLISLRASKTVDAGRYQVPRAGLFKLVACPNYGGEILEWLGWAVLTWSPAGFAFFAFTAANLVPRAIAHHRWYAENFPKEFDPAATKAIIPFVL